VEARDKIEHETELPAVAVNDGTIDCQEGMASLETV
jgi:hypothetical protein